MKHRHILTAGLAPSRAAQIILLALTLLIGLCCLCGTRVAFAAEAANAEGSADASASASASAVPPRDAFPATLKIGVLNSGWAPFEIVTQGEVSGLSVDYLRLLIGPTVKLETRAFADMPTLLAAACAGEVDILTSIARTPQRERCLSFSNPYFRASAAIVMRRDVAATALREQLNQATLSIEKGFALERVMRDRFPHAQFVTFDDTVSALRAVANGKADAYAGFGPAIEYYLADSEFRDLSIAFDEADRVSGLRFAVPRSQSALRDQLNRALASLPPGDVTAIRARWLGDSFDIESAHATRRFALSPDEKTWLRSLPALTVGIDTGWAPFSYLDRSGRPAGIANDYLDYLSRTLGVTFLRESAADWPSSLHAFLRGNLAMLAVSSGSDPHPADALLARTYERYPLAIVGRDEALPARGLAQFSGESVAMSAHAAGEQTVTQSIPPANRVIADNVEAGFEAVENGTAAIYVGNLAAIEAAMKAGSGRQLKILGTLPDDESLGFAVQRQYAPLAGLIERAMLAMPASERQRIGRRWVTDGVKPGDPWNVSALRLLPLLIVGAVVLLITLRAYLLLQRQVIRRRRIERELALQLKFQRTMMEMVPYPLVAKDLEGRYIAVNRAFEELCGLQRADVIGHTSIELHTWGESNSRDLEAMAQQTLRTGERRHLELGFVDRFGDMRHGIFWSCLCRGVDGSPVCMLGTVVDITDIRRAELLARETERRLFDVTRWLPAAVFQLRRDPDGTYSFTYISGNARYLMGDDFGTPKPGKSLDTGRIFDEDRVHVLSELERSAAEEVAIHLEFRVKAGARLQWCRAELVPRRQDDGSVVWSGYWVDANAERARSDELARARDQAEAASRAKDDFLAMMSHEIRTPMNGVLGLVEVLERTQLNADQGEMLGMIHESAGALLQILDDLLDYSKIEASRLTIESEPLQLRELVDTAVGLLAGRAHEKGLKVRIDIAPEVAATHRGDSVRLRQILFNLLSNAIKFTPAGEVDVRVVVIEAREGAQLIEISVEDTGIGIAPDVQTQLFEPFVQAESSTTRRFGGTGLGLTICRKLVQLMGGTLELQSTPGVGTRMMMQLSMPAETQALEIGKLRGRRGIVVMRDARVAQALMNFAQAMGIELRRVAPDSPELLDPAKLSLVDLLFVDESIDVPAAARASVRVICTTEKPKPTGYRVLGDKVRLSINPISWRGLGAACAAAMGGFAPLRGNANDIDDAPPVVPDRERAIASGRLVLVAEDHPVNQELIRHQLALLGFACDIVNDGAEALDALARTRYGCLVTDCHMPNLSGYELARRVRELEQQHDAPDGAPSAAARLPILGITANTAPEDLRQCREAGMDDCLVKPTRLATLRDHLNRWFGADGAKQPVSNDNPSSEANPVPKENASTSYVPVDLAHMTKLWGSESTVKSLLDAFVTSVRDDLGALPPLLGHDNVDPLIAWHHRIAGAAGVLQYTPLQRALEAYRQSIDVKTVEQLRTDGLVLVQACHAMLDGIEEQAALLA